MAFRKIDNIIKKNKKWPVRKEKNMANDFTKVTISIVKISIACRMTN